MHSFIPLVMQHSPFATLQVQVAAPFSVHDPAHGQTAVIKLFGSRHL